MFVEKPLCLTRDELAKIEAAAKSGIGRVIIPTANMKDVLIDDEYKDMIEVIPVRNLTDVLDASLVAGERKVSLVERLGDIVGSLTSDPTTRPA